LFRLVVLFIIESPGHDFSVQSRMENERADIYEYIGFYENHDARRLLDAFVERGIEFTLDINQMGIETMSAVSAAHGGTFGAGVGLAIGVQVDDLEEALVIREKVLKILP
jgi:hypothetical protein